MGATVSCNRKVAAFRDGEKIIYVGFESTYEKNCYPHTPHWSPVFIGDHEAAIQSIFRFGSVCEGGMLQDRDGYVLPEVYIGRWLRALAYPIHMPNLAVEFEDKTTGLLHERYRDVEAARKEGRGLWRIMGSQAPDGEPDKTLGYRAKPVPESELPPLEGGFMAYGADERLSLGNDGKWAPVGWCYSVVGQFIQSYAQAEIEHPGHYAARIAAYRKLVREAPACPSDAIVHVADPAILDRHDSQAATRLREQFGAEFRWGDLLKHDDAKSRAYDALNRRICVWTLSSEVDDGEDKEVSGQEPSSQRHQENLF